MSSHQFQFNTVDVNTNNVNTYFTNTTSEPSSPLLQINGIDESLQTPLYQQAQIGRSKTAPNNQTSRKGHRIRHTSSTSNLRANRYGGAYPYTSPQSSSRESSRSPSPTTSQILDNPEPIEDRTCQACQRVFSRARDLKRHFHNSNAHDAPAKFQCFLCKQEFKRCDVIKRHTYNKKCLDTFLNFDDDKYETS
ncbi:hypothetical protein BDA99DRAFT_506461 [Phascolomyces articulosus]|uniref:C2H2-type domain-containing protein n=1 Tax=Phascolomyces articulosus TaxID=60185 RepID=A0AAD5K2U7_9FUNG|nr:hypothetical protein BDA99DRAFT_506461 [Phascolomyces articulosus]